MRALRLVLLVAVVLGVAAPGFAWTAATRVRMVDDAVKLMPPTLRKVLEARRDAVLSGMLTPMTGEDGPPHRPPWDAGTLEGSVSAAAHDLVAGVDGQISFRDVAKRFGTLAHFVADAGFPPGAAGASGAAHYAHFGTFCESRRGRFPLVFYGHDNPALARGDFKAFTLAVLERERKEDVTLAQAYASAPSWDDPASFDDRSVPFAVASLAYSHSVTDIVQAWLAAWRQCHGDLGGTPYMGPPPPKGSKP
jgi:hypothetical protein